MLDLYFFNCQHLNSKFSLIHYIHYCFIDNEYENHGYGGSD